MKPVLYPRISLVLISLVLLTFLLGCGSSPPSALSYNFKQGLADVTMRLLPQAPPEKIYPSSSFKIMAELDNQLAYDLTEGTVSIVGLDQQYFQVIPLQQTIPVLLGRSFTAPSGEKTMVEFDGTAQYLIDNAKEYVGNYFLTLRYNSNVDFSDSICINPNLYDVYDAGCKVQPQKSYSGQGAPVAVTKLEEIITPGAAVEFRLTVANRGRGKVNSLTLGAARLGSQEMTCLFGGTAGNSRTITWPKEKQEVPIICRAILKDQSSYTTTIAVDFTYSYERVEQQKLRMVR